VIYSSSAAGANAPRQLVAGAIMITATMILSHTSVDSLNKSKVCLDSSGERGRIKGSSLLCLEDKGRPYYFISFNDSSQSTEATLKSQLKFEIHMIK
jgi:hypothetical protein